MNWNDKAESALKWMAAKENEWIVFFCFFLLWIIPYSYPSTFLFEYSASQIFKCSVKVDNPTVRSGLGVLGLITAPYSWFPILIAKAAQEGLGNIDVPLKGVDCNLSQGSY